jgi:hypothetical protein
MITRNFKKKLTLNKKTIVNLGKPTMSKVYGGNPQTVNTCVTCFIRACAIVNPTDFVPLPIPK